MRAAHAVAYNAIPENRERRAATRATPKNKAIAAAYYVANRGKIRARQAATRATPEARARENGRYAANPTRRVEMLLRNRLNSAIGRGSRRGSAVALLGCTIPELMARFETLFTDGMTWDNRGAWHIDHIRPLASFDLEDVDQLAVACHWSNLQPLWAADNLRKGARFD